MLVPVNHSDLRMEFAPVLAVTSNCSIDVSDIRTVEVNNISRAASIQDIKEFFSFSGDIEYLEMQSESESSQLAYVTFKDSKGAETAMLLSGATIVDRAVNVTPAENYQLPVSAFPLHSCWKNSSDESPVWKAEDMVSSMLAKGFILGKDALNKAKAFDEEHHLISNASTTVASIDRKMGLSEKLRIGAALLNEKVRQVDERFLVAERTRSALSVAEQTASSAGSALMSNGYFSTGASWFRNAMSMVAKTAEEVTLLTKEKVEKAEEEKKESIYREINNFAQVHLDDEFLVTEGGAPVLI